MAMNRSDFMRIVSIIKSSYRAEWLSNEDVLTAFYNFCIQFEYETCKAAVIDLIESGNDDQPVTLQVIEHRIRREADIRKRPVPKPAEVCRFCGGKGFTIHTYPSGRDYLTPCPCPVGREKYESYFWSDEEEKEYWDEQKRHGISKPQYMTAPASVHKRLKYDEHETEVFARRQREVKER